MKINHNKAYHTTASRSWPYTLGSIKPRYYINLVTGLNKEIASLLSDV